MVTRLQFARLVPPLSVTPETVKIRLLLMHTGSGETVTLPPDRNPLFTHSLHGKAQQTPLVQHRSAGQQVPLQQT